MAFSLFLFCHVIFPFLSCLLIWMFFNCMISALGFVLFSTECEGQGYSEMYQVVAHAVSFSFSLLKICGSGLIFVQ